MHYRYHTIKGSEIIFEHEYFILNGKKYSYTKIEKFDFDMGSDYTTLYINGKTLKITEAKKRELNEVKQTILWARKEVNSIVTEPTEESRKRGILWQARERTWFGAKWTFTIYKLTDNRLFVDSGVLNKTQNELRLYRIIDISLKRNIIQRIFKMGTITITASDKDTPQLKIKNIKEPEKVKEMIAEQVEVERERNNVRTGEFVNGDIGFGQMI